MTDLWVKFTTNQINLKVLQQSPSQTRSHRFLIMKDTKLFASTTLLKCSIALLVLKLLLKIIWTFNCSTSPRSWQVQAVLSGPAIVGLLPVGRDRGGRDPVRGWHLRHLRQRPVHPGRMRSRSRVRKNAR